MIRGIGTSSASANLKTDDSFGRPLLCSHDRIAVKDKPVFLASALVVVPQASIRVVSSMGEGVGGIGLVRWVSPEVDAVTVDEGSVVGAFDVGSDQGGPSEGSAWPVGLISDVGSYDVTVGEVPSWVGVRGWFCGWFGLSVEHVDDVDGLGFDFAKLFAMPCVRVGDGGRDRVPAGELVLALLDHD